MSRGVSSFSVFRLSSQPGYLALPFCGEIPVTFWYVSQILERPRRRPERRLPETVSEGRSSCGRKYLLRKAVCRLTGHMKALKNAHNTGFLRLARPGSAGRVVSVWGEKVGRAAPALCLSLLNSPLVNRVLGHSSWSAKPGSTAKYSGIRRGGLSLIPGRWCSRVAIHPGEAWERLLGRTAYLLQLPVQALLSH